MKVECKVQNSRLIIVFDDVRSYYIVGDYVENYFIVRESDYHGRKDMTNAEKNAGIKAIEKFNSVNALQISIVDD